MTSKSMLRAKAPKGGSAVLTFNEWTVVSRDLCLSIRELQVVQGVFNDQKEAAIAFALGIATATVGTYLDRVYHKLHVSSRASMMVRVFETHLRAQSLSAGPSPSVAL